MTPHPGRDRRGWDVGSRKGGPSSTGLFGIGGVSWRGFCEIKNRKDKNHVYRVWRD